MCIRDRDYAKALEGSQHPREMRARLDREEDALRAVEDRRLSREWDRLYEARRARYLNWPRAKLLVVAGVLVTAPIESSVSPIDFLNQQMTAFGKNWTASPLSL